MDYRWTYIHIAGVPGGTILAILYSHRFDVEYLHHKLYETHPAGLLVLDDIADSGKTISDLREEMFKPVIATLHYKSPFTSLFCFSLYYVYGLITNKRIGAYL